MAHESILRLGFRAGFGKASLDQENLQRFDDAFGSNFRCHTQLAQLLFADQCELMPALVKNDSEKQTKVRYDKGTSTLCFKYKGGGVVATESGATGGEYIGFTS
uniref:Putative 20s proteasome regulatory subunit beta n=1 Tax=Ixodes ricinus TaxID=34613 RepID=A0A6B0UFR0_IXORI